jgi:hypothetical protein
VDQDFTFDRFTESARLTLFHARVAVSEHGGTTIIDAHLLLGLFKAAPELGPLMRPSVNVQRLAECLVGAVAGPSLPPTSTEVLFDPAVKAALLEAARLADGFSQWDVTYARRSSVNRGDHTRTRTRGYASRNEGPSMTGPNSGRTGRRLTANELIRGKRSSRRGSAAFR